MMSNKTAPECDPLLGTWTPAYLKWALVNLDDDTFKDYYRCDKATAKARAGAPESKPVQPEEPAHEVTPEEVNDTATAEPQDEPTTTPTEEEVTELDEDIAALDAAEQEQMQTDLKEMHHSSFKKKYDVDADEYKQLKANL